MRDGTVVLALNPVRDDVAGEVVVPPICVGGLAAITCPCFAVDENPLVGLATLVRDDDDGLSPSRPGLRVVLAFAKELPGKLLVLFFFGAPALDNFLSPAIAPVLAVGVVTLATDDLIESRTPESPVALACVVASPVESAPAILFPSASTSVVAWSASGFALSD